jgi:hypothetical protein
MIVFAWLLITLEIILTGALRVSLASTFHRHVFHRCLSLHFRFEDSAMSCANIATTWIFLLRLL